MDQTEREAIERILAGDRDAFRVLVDRHYAFAFRVAFRITANPSDAEEVTQDAFLRAYKALPTFRQDASFSTWVNRIVMNTALNLVERRTRDLTHRSEPDDIQIPDLQAGPERLLLDREATTLRQAAMSGLTPMERTAFTLRHMEELSIAEIAEALHIPANSAKQAVFRAVAKLRRSLAPIAGGTR